MDGVHASRPSLSLHGIALALRRVGTSLREAILLAGPIAALEAIGPLTRNDGYDLMVLFAAMLVVIVLAQAARAGWLPLSSRLLGVVRSVGRTLLRRLSPRYAVAFRPAPEARPLADHSLAVPIAWLTGLFLGLGALGHLTLSGLGLVKVHVSYTLYLAGLVAVWALMLLTVLLCAVSLQQWFAQRSRKGQHSGTPYLLGVGGWLLGMVALAVVPGAIAVAVLLIIGWFGGRGLQTAPQQNYLFCRRDENGRSRTIAVQGYLRQVHTAIVLALAVVVVLGQSQRLWEPWRPSSPFEFTGWIGLMASLAAIVLTARTTGHFRRLLGGDTVPPEVPLTPTLWIRRSRTREFGGAEERREAYWYRVARESGWLVLRDTRPPKHPWDLVMGEPAQAAEDDRGRRFLPREPADDDDARFQLERRFQIVMRRRFRREFEGLFKALRGENPDGGTGFLICPHVWLVPGVVRDVESGDRSGASGALVGPSFYGPPFNRALDSRVRRYIGSVLRNLEIDILYLEDAVTWKDVRRVLGVAFEIHDQGRAPLLERHFAGLPRLRVMIQEEPAEPEPPQAIPGAEPTPEPDPAPGHARILLIMRDRGQNEETLALDPADYGIKTPQLV